MNTPNNASHNTPHNHRAQPAAASSPSLFHLAGTTPLSDALRGRLTGRLDIPAACARAQLPAPLAGLVLKTVHRTRLWRGEKAEVAAELISHFSEGLATGATPETLISTFGDTRVVARLIGRAKRQCRSPLWKLWISGWKLLALLLALAILLYGVLAIRLYTGRPTLRTNPVQQLNAPTLAIAEHDRAWTIYKQAVASIEVVPDRLLKADANWPDIGPDSPYRPEAMAYLDRQQAAIALIHDGASRPRLGYILSDQIEPGMEGFDSNHTPIAWDEPGWDENPPAVGILLPPLAKLRLFTNLLVFDSMVAREQRDASRLAQNIRTTIALAEHVRDLPFLISDLVGIAVIARACDEIFKTLETVPDLLTDEQLIELAHTLGVFPRDGGSLVRIETETHFFEDSLQRMYTDDGNGNGRMTPAGYRYLAQLTSEMPPSPAKPAINPYNPIDAAIIADRASTRREYNALFGTLTTSIRAPLWTWTQSPNHEFKTKSQNFLWTQQYPAIYLLTPAFGQAAVASHRAEQTRDAALTAIALELFKRRYGDYPASLGELTPALLPRVPLDIFDGSPLKYQVRSGRPLLYSVGTDRKDDAGRSPSTRHTDGAYTWYPPDDIDALLADPLRGPQIDGDWVLYPRPVSKLPANLPAEDPTSEHTSDPASENVPE